MISRREFVGLGATGLVMNLVSSSVAAEPVWSGPRDVDEFSVLGDEVLTVGSSLRALDAATGQERRAVRLRRPSEAEGPATIASTDSAIVFGWYVWYEDLFIFCADPRSLQIRWQRRMKITERERAGGIPSVFPLIRPEGLFVLVAHKHSENLFRLRPDNGETMWSRYIERFAVRSALAWYSNRLLVRSRVTRGAEASGDLHAIDPGNGSTAWRLRLEGHDYMDRDTILISANRAYVASPVYPGESARLHIVDLDAGAIVKSLAIDRLGDPFAYDEGVLYFGGTTPTAWDLATERAIWRAELRERRGILQSISDAAFDSARRRVYLGELKSSFYVLSATDGAILGSVDVRRGHTSPSMMALYGASRLRLVRDVLLVGAGDRRLLAFATASL
jgi:outer membrane protein assembly factor BamB